MISVLIPIYNFDVTGLVKELLGQAKQSNIQVEIICLDDCSSDEWKSKNEVLSEMDSVSYEALESNVGRSRIRNLLAEKARQPYLLFMDCDSEVSDPNFLTNYAEALSEDALVYGGRTYATSPPETQFYFRWYYGSEREVSSAEQRSETPYKSFMTNNFLIPKAIINKIRFDESLIQYGHEDTLFGHQLENHGIKIIHIDNPLIHVGLETCEEFLEKTLLGVENLHTLFKTGKLVQDVKLLQAFKVAKRSMITTQLANQFQKKRKQLEENFASNNPSLRKFDLYKLGYLCYLESQS